MSKMFSVLVVAALAILHVHAATYYVNAARPNDTGAGTSWASAKMTIQAAVNVAVSNDIVLVTNGVYAFGNTITPGATLKNRLVVTNAIMVQSVNGPASTTIQGASTPINVRCAYLSGNAALVGFTLTNGHTVVTAPQSSSYWKDALGGGVYAVDAVLSNCVLTGNTAYDFGGGVYGGTLINCVLSSNVVFYANAMSSSGGGACHSTLIGCLLTGNEGTAGGGASFCTLTNCTVAANNASYAGGGVSAGTLDNSIVYNNTAPRSPNYTGPEIRISFSCVNPDPGGEGNITVNPRFLAANNYRLAPDSPCINAGKTVPWMAGSLDMDGNPRIMSGGVEMGAYETSAPAPVKLVVLSAYGGASPPVGTNSFVLDTQVVCGVTNSPVANGVSTQYVCTGASVLGNAYTQASPTNVTLTLTNNATLAWQWQTQSRLTTGTNGNGNVVPANGWFASGSNVVVTATPVIGWHFFGWGGNTNGCSIVGNVITVPMNQARAVQAIFEVDHYTVIFNPMGGTVNPESVTVTNGSPYGPLPTPLKPGYSFAGWWTQAGGAGLQVTAATIVEIVSDHTLYAKWSEKVTTTTPVPVPYAWLDQYPALLSLASNDYEVAAHADIDGDGHAAWQEYVTGSVPTNRDSVLRTRISVNNGMPWLTWSPDLGTARVYTVNGITNLMGEAWGPTNSGSRFFRVKALMP